MNNILLFILNKTISYIGTKLFLFALSWKILSETGSGMSYSISMLVNYIPSIFFSLLISKHGMSFKKPGISLAICDVISASVCLIVLLGNELIYIYICIFLLSSINAVFNNIADSCIPELKDVEHNVYKIKKINSLLQFITSVINIVGPALSGILVSAFKIEYFIFINMASFFLSAIGEIHLIYIKENAPTGAQTGKGVSFTGLFRFKTFKEILIADGISNFFVTAGVTISMPILLTDILRLTSAQYGYMTSMLAVGSAFSAVKNIKFPPNTDSYPFKKLFFLGISIMSFGILIMKSYNIDQFFILFLLSVLIFCNGWYMASINIQTSAIIQIEIPDELRGSALGIITAFSYFLIPISILISGYLSDISNNGLLPTIAGLCLSSFSILMSKRKKINKILSLIKQ